MKYKGKDQCVFDDTRQSFQRTASSYKKSFDFYQALTYPDFCQKNLPVFIEAMQDHLSPSIVLQIINGCVYNHNIEGAQWLFDQPWLRKGCDDRCFFDVAIRHNTMYKTDNLSDWYGCFDPDIEEVLIPALAIGTIAVQMLDSNQRTLSVVQALEENANRVSIVREGLNKWFETWEQHDYMHDGLPLDDEQINMLITPIIEELSNSEIQQWIATPWPLDNYFKIREQPKIQRELLLQHTGSNANTIKRKM